MEFEITTIGERGQVVIPKEFRESMSLRTGEKFIVIERGDMLVFKRLKEPSIEDFEVMIKKSHEHAKKHKLSGKDLDEAIKRVRSQN